VPSHREQSGEAVRAIYAESSRCTVDWRKSDGTRNPVSDGKLYTSKLSVRFEGQETKKTGNKGGSQHKGRGDRKVTLTHMAILQQLSS
jgi:hypothetical protein